MNLVVPQTFTGFFERVFTITCGVASYGLLPVILLFYTDFIYHYRLQYMLGAITALLLLAFLYKLQDRLLYYPEMPPTSLFYVPLPTHFPYEIVTFSTDDGEKLHGFFIKAEDMDAATAPTIVYFHGNAGNAGSPCTLLLAKCGANVLSVDYRGYGKSTGSPSENGLYLDGKACVEYVASRNDVDPNKIVLLGHSLGGAVAIHLAAMAHDSDYRIAALILENTFTTLPNAAKHIFQGFFPLISKLPGICYSNKFLSVEKIASVHVPTLFIVGEKDEVVAPSMTRTLFNALLNNPHKILMRVPRGTHNDTWCVSKHYHRFLCLFLTKVFTAGVNERSANISSKAVQNNEMSWKCEVVAD